MSPRKKQSQQSQQSQRKSSTQSPDPSLTGASTVKVTIIQLIGVLTIIGSVFAAYYKVNGTLDTHSTQINHAEEVQGKINTKVDGLATTVNDLHEKAAVADVVQKNIADKLTEIGNKVNSIQMVVTPNHK